MKNSEILFLYGAKLCNPNGDPDEENRPRIDPKTSINLVSDLRLKRYLRDHIINSFGEEFVWVSTVKGEHKTSDHRLDSLSKQWEIKKNKEKSELANLVTKYCIDARLFGATIPIRAMERKRGESKALVGPVQFTWGYSLHPVELVESSTITSIFSGREAAERYGTIGKDWRLYYSLIAFYGVVSGLRAEKIGLKEADLKLLDNLLWDSLMLEATTRSKIGETPYLYLRVEYNDSDILIGDFRKYIDVSWKEPIRDFKNVKLEFGRLINVIKEKIDKIKTLYFRKSDEMEEYKLEENLKGIFMDKLLLLPHKELQNKKDIKKLLTITE